MIDYQINNILKIGSGDFSVIRGGTFYPDGERPYKSKATEDYFGSGSTFYNSHGQPVAEKLTGKCF